MASPGTDLDTEAVARVIAPARSGTRSGEPSGAPSTVRSLPTPDEGRWAAEAYVKEHLGHLVDRRGIDLPDSSSVYRGGQRAAEAALAAFDVTGYAARVGEAYPQPRRSVSGLSPWIRHGLLPLPRLWNHVADGPPDDVRAFRGALLWQEYARHRYARFRTAHTSGSAGSTGAAGSTGPADDPDQGQRSSIGRGWNRQMGCVELPLDELEEDGWVVGPARRWLASHWAERQHDDPDEGREHFFRHLLDGSRAANGLGWHDAAVPTVTRWEVEEHAPGLCASCDLVAECPIERPRSVGADTNAGTTPTGTSTDTDTDTGASPAVGILAGDRDLPGTTGPRVSISNSSSAPEAVWLTAESLGDADPALAANPDLPAVFVFDEPLLAALRLSSKRLVFLVETLGDLAGRRAVEVHLGAPVDALTGRPLTATFTPVPGWRRRAAQLDLVRVEPWPWLREPKHGDITDFDTWRAGLT